MFKQRFNQRKALRFRQFSRKGYALFACLGRVVTICVLSVATLRSAAATKAADVTVADGSAIGITADDDDVTVADGSPTGITAAADSTDKMVTLDDIEVTASRAPLALGQTARIVTVLSREDIQAAPVQSINDILKMAVGVDVRQRGPIGAQTDVSIRGGTQEQMTILLNGINICDPQTGHNSFDLPCDIGDIERIEILEGPAGRIYGTSSLVGAINVVTRQNEKSEPTVGSQRESQMRNEKWGGGSHVQARVEGGSFGYLSAAASISHLTLPIAHSSSIVSHLSASVTRSDGYSRSKAGNLNSDYHGGKLFYQGHYNANQLRIHWHAGLSTKGYGSNTFYSAKYDEQYERTTKLYTALQGEIACNLYEKDGKVFGLHLKPSIYWNRSHDRFELIRGSEEKVPFNYHRTDVFGINLNSWFDWLLGRTAFGAEFRNEDIVSTNLGEPLNEPFSHYKAGLNRSNLSFHLEHNIVFSHFTLSAGFVAVKNTWNQMPFTVYPGIDASLRLGNHWKVYASYNASLRMPSFTELYYSVGGHKADKYLKPEELHAVEGGVKYYARAVTAQASVFHHHGHNMIDWVMDTREPDAVWQSVNHTKINAIGIEASATLDLERACHLPHSTLLVAYCYQHQRKDEEPFIQSQYALEYLRHKLTATLRCRLTEQLGLTVNYRWQDRMGSYTDTSGNICDYHPYSVVDARLSWTADTWSLYLEGNNLTGHRYIDYGNVPQPGTWLTVGCKWHISF